MILSQNSPSFLEKEEQVVIVGENPRQIECASSVLMAVARFV
jgi:hypothetical protein